MGYSEMNLGGWAVLLEFVNESLHARVPAKYITPECYRLGGWVSRQGQTQDKLSEDRHKCLVQLSLIWGFK